MGICSLAASAVKALDVIAMLVCDEDALEQFRRAPDLRQALPNLAAAETRIDQNPGVFGFEVSAVAAGTAAQNRESHSHEPTLEQTAAMRATVLRDKPAVSSSQPSIQASAPDCGPSLPIRTHSGPQPPPHSQALYANSVPSQS